MTVNSHQEIITEYLASVKLLASEKNFYTYEEKWLTFILWELALFFCDGVNNYQSFLSQGFLDCFVIKAVTELCFIKDKSVYIEIILEENNAIIGEVDISQYGSRGFILN